MFLFGWGNLGRSNTLGEGPGLPGDDTARDSATKTVALGLIVPAAIVAIAVFNVVVGRAYWPTEHGGSFIHVYARFWAVAGTIGFKLGVAMILHAWFGLANWRRTEHLCHPLAACGIGVGLIGLITFVIGAL
ncbi:MAG: hypothetical protein ACHRHE_24165 [Tepidisphaerales bacterium]